MLDPWIIEEILKREEAERQREQPRIELPVPPPVRELSIPAANEVERGVVIIDI